MPSHDLGNNERLDDFVRSNSQVQRGNHLRVQF